MGGLLCDGQFFSYQEITDLKVSTSIPYFESCLNFCRDFLLGKTEFPIKTSGSTGTPDTVFLTRRQLEISAQRTIDALSLKKEYKCLVCISTDHIGGKMMLVRGMKLGMTLYVVEPTADITKSYLPKIDFVAIVPLQLKSLLSSNAGREFLSTCKVVLIGGAPIDPEDETQLENFVGKMYQSFGMTETASHIALRRLNGPDKKDYFKSLEGVNLSVDDRGCLVINGDVTNNNPVVTNDLVDLNATGGFKWLDRLDSAINSGGYKILPSKLRPVIARVLTAAGIESDFTIIGLPDKKWGQRVTLVLESEGLNKKMMLSIIKALKSELHPYELPKSIEHIKTLPRTLTGKIDGKRLCEILSD